MNHRTHRLLVVLATGAMVTALPVTAPAVAAGETCQGVPATIVGPVQGTTLPRTIAGTPGDDVIVSNGASIVSGNAGNDLICTTNSQAAGVTVLGGIGNDVIDRREDTHPPAPAQVLLGSGERSGADTFFGSTGEDEVYVFDGAGPDVVATGAGDDSVSASSNVVRSGSLSVDLGEGDDRLQLGLNMIPTSLSIIEQVLPGNDVVQAPTTGTTGRMNVAAATGRDEIVVRRSTKLRTVELDLAAGTLRTRRTLVATLTGFEDVDASSRGTVQVTGDTAANTIVWAACAGGVNAGDGNDTVRRAKGVCRGAALPVFRTFGGRGQDDLFGTKDRDLLIGGHGRDHGTGGPGHDVCRSIEVPRSC